MKWSEITKDPVYQSLPSTAQQQLKVAHFEKYIAPKLEDAPEGISKDMVFSAWMSKPDDSGQGMLTSMASSAVRGATSIVPNVIGGAGYLLGSEGMVDAATQLESGINSYLPINPALADTFAVKAANAAGQAVGMIATGGATGAAARTVGTVAQASKAAQGVMLTQGFLSGAREGGQSAERMGLTGEQAYARSVIGGGIELASETLLFGMGSELRAARAAATDTIESGVMRFAKATGTESVEEAAAQVGGNVADIGFAPQGYNAPGVLSGVGEAMALGAVGGGVFGLANLGGSSDQTPTTAPTIAPDGTTTTTPATPQPTTFTPIRLPGLGGVYIRDEKGAWSQTGIVPTTLGGSTLRPLDPTDSNDSFVLEDLNRKASRIDATLARVTPTPAMTPDPNLAPAPTVTPAPPVPVVTAPPATSELDQVWEALTAAKNRLSRANDPAEIAALNEIVAKSKEFIRNSTQQAANDAVASGAPDINLERDAVLAQQRLDQTMPEAAEAPPMQGQEFDDTIPDEPFTALDVPVTPEARAAQGFTNTAITRDLSAGFISIDGFAALAGLARSAYAAGKNAMQWAGDMISQFGAGIKKYLRKAWMSVLPLEVSRNVNLGSPAKTNAVRVRRRGSVLNPFPAPDQQAAIKEVDPQEVIPPNETLEDNLKEITSSMARFGWIGNPLIVIPWRNKLKAINGSHRRKAALDLGIKVPVLSIDPNLLADWIKANQGKVVGGVALVDIDQFATRMDEDLQLLVLEAAKQDGLKVPGLDQAINILTQEATEAPAPAAPAAAPAPAPAPAPAQQQPTPADRLKASRRPFMKGIEHLRAGMKLVKSTVDERTSEGQTVPDTAYVVRTDAAMAAASQMVLDDLLYTQTSGEDLLSLIATGSATGVDFTLRPDEAAIIGRNLINSGRFHEFGLTRNKVVRVMQELAGEAGTTNRAWRYVLDPLDRIKSEADEKTRAAMDDVEVPDWVAFEAELAAAADAEIDAKVREAIAKVKRKLENKGNMSSPMDLINSMFFPEDKTLAQKLAEDGANAIASAFFRGKAKDAKPGPLQEGADFVKGELSSLLNEALDTLGIERASETKDPNLEYRRLITELGLMDMRSNKLAVIDQLVRDRIAEYAENGSTQFADDLLDQWEQVSAHMAGSTASQASLRKVVNMQLAETEQTMSKLAKLPTAEGDAAIESMVNTAMARVAKLGDPAAGGLAPDALQRLDADMRATANTMLKDARDKAAQRKALRDAYKKSPEAVTKTAQGILDVLIDRLNGVQPDPAKRNELRSLISEAITADEDMMRLRELLMDMGVEESVAASLELVVLESRRNREAAADALREKRRKKAREKAIEDMIERLYGRKKNKVNADKLARFLNNLKRADEFGVLDEDMFTDAFANAFNLSGLTPAVVGQLRVIWQELQSVDNKGKRRLYGSARQFKEDQFKAAVNAVAPGIRWDNFIFDQYVSGVLSSVGSIMNQFSGIFKSITGVDAFARTATLGAPQKVVSEWLSNSMNMIMNLPLILEGVNGTPLGNLPASVKGNFAPSEQSIQMTGAGQTLRMVTPRGSTITVSENFRKVARLKSLFTWRAIYAAEALSSTTDFQARYRDVVAAFYKKQGMSAAEAYDKAVNNLNGNPDDKAQAEAQARAEQAAGVIPPGENSLKVRIRQNIENIIDERLGEDFRGRVEQLVAFSQFKTVPTGMIGYPIYYMFNQMASADSPGSRVGRFFLLFGRFLGHTVDTMFAYTPLTLMTMGRTSSKSVRNKNIREIFGDVETYNKQQAGKAAAGTAFIIANGMLAALAAALADDDEEPVYQIFGTAPAASREQKETLRASGKWQEGVVRIAGVNFNYLQIPELSALFTALGNASDYARFSQQLYTKDGVPLEITDAAFSSIPDVLTSPIKRSTYRQYFEAVSNTMAGRKSDAIANILTSPIGGITRIPLVVDADKFYREMEGGKDAKGYGQNILRRLPFVHIGDTMINAYGETLQGIGVIGMLPPDDNSPPDVVKAATINAETGTTRSTPKLPEMVNGVEVTSEQKEQYAKLAGGFYVESLLRNESAVRRAFANGGQAAAKKIISNISSKSNERARKQLDLDKK